MSTDMELPVTIPCWVAIEALSAMRRIAKEGGYKMPFADDASFIGSAMATLERVTK